MCRTLGEATCGSLCLVVIPNRPHIRKMQTAIIAGAADRPRFGVIEEWAMNGKRSPLITNLQAKLTTEPRPCGFVSKRVPPKIPGLMKYIFNSLDLPNLPQHRHTRLMIADGASGAGLYGRGMGGRRTSRVTP